jgi:hypothetical protein
MLEISISAEVLLTIVAVILSIMFEKLPNLKRWFDTVESVYKPLVMALLSTATVLIVFSISCFYPLKLEFNPTLACNAVGFHLVFLYSFATFGGNQAFFAVLKYFGLDEPVAKGYNSAATRDTDNGKFG